ncbi:MAG: copper-binding protein [Terricaulis sp.]
MLKALVLPIAMLSAACTQPASEPAAKSDMQSMSDAAASAAAASPVSGAGVVTQVDAAAGTVTFNHEAIPAISWPAMTMQFHAEDPAILQGIAVGDHVAFELKSPSETSVVTMVQKQ